MLKGLKSLFAGIVAGTALGILFSPKKGEDIRKNFKNEIKKGGTGLKTLKATVTELGEDIGETAKEAYDEVKKSPSFKKGKAKAKKVVKKAVAKGKKAVQKGENAIKKATKKVTKKKSKK